MVSYRVVVFCMKGLKLVGLLGRFICRMVGKGLVLWFLNGFFLLFYMFLRFVRRVRLYLRE